MHSRLSSKGRVTIPKEVRERLGLEPGDFVTHEITDGNSAILRRADSYDASFRPTMFETFEEWGSDEDEEAFRDL